MNPFLTGSLIILFLGSAFTASEVVRIETIVVTSLGLIVLGASTRRWFRR
jgi:hypothetical protein